MRDIGIFTSKRVPLEELVEFMRSYASGVGQPLERRSHESVLGEPPAFFTYSTQQRQRTVTSATRRKQPSNRNSARHLRATSAFTSHQLITRSPLRMPWRTRSAGCGTGFWITAVRGVAWHSPLIRSAAQSRPRRIDEITGAPTVGMHIGDVQCIRRRLVSTLQRWQMSDFVLSPLLRSSVLIRSLRRLR